MRTALFLLIASTWLTAQVEYFQQEVSYDIQARLDEPTHTLHCDLTLQYTNRAPPPPRLHLLPPLAAGL